MAYISKAPSVSDAVKVRSQMRAPVGAAMAASPWEVEAPSGKPNKAYQRQVLDTCPWGPPSEDTQSVKSGRAPQHNTCPWGEGGLTDAHTAAQQRAERLRQRVPPSQVGCAGVGAPRAPARGAPEPQQEQDFFPDQQQQAVAASDTEPVSFTPTYDSDADAQERSMLIEKCLEHGLSDEEIEGVLKEHIEHKEMERQQREAQSMSLTLSQPLPQPDLVPANTSLAAQRQAKAKGIGKGNVFGPSDDEVANMMYGNLSSSPEAAGEAGSHRANRLRKKDEVTGKIGDLGSTVRKGAFLDSHQVANAAKDRNRNGQGIF